MGHYINYLWTSRKPRIYLGENCFFIEFGFCIMLVMLIETYLNKACNKVCIGKHLSYVFPVLNDLKFHHHCFSTML